MGSSRMAITFVGPLEPWDYSTSGDDGPGCLQKFSDRDHYCREMVLKRIAFATYLLGHLTDHMGYSGSRQSLSELFGPGTTATLGEVEISGWIIN